MTAVTVQAPVIPQQARRVITVTGEPGGLPAVFEDPAAEHQIVHRSAGGGHRIAVSCTCLKREQGVIGIRQRWAPGEAYAAWKAWHEDNRKQDSA